ncbi:hypothetical protein GKG29_19580 [Escherichia coli]|nr:hypothetical protein [Escherichia coli]
MVNQWNNQTFVHYTFGNKAIAGNGFRCIIFVGWSPVNKLRGNFSYFLGNQSIESPVTPVIFALRPVPHRAHPENEIGVL